MSEGILLGKFVAVLNSKKEEIARLRRDVAQLTEKLAAERARAGPATGSPAAAIPEALPLNHEEETDDGSDVTDSEDEEDEIVSAVRPPGALSAHVLIVRGYQCVVCSYPCS